MIQPDESPLLDRLTLGGAPASAVAASGLRRSRAGGAGMEFHEYRRYQPGDDPRSIDWTVEARLQQLVVRVARAESDARLHVLLDVSGSMGLGTPDKLACARRIASALCYVAIEGRDAAAACSFSDRVQRHVGSASGRSHLFRIFAMLAASSPAGPSNLDNALTSYGGIARGPGLVVVLSDFFDASSCLDGFRYLIHRGLTPALVQILSPEEVRPDLDTEVELVDVENPLTPTVVVDEGARGAYLHGLQQHADALRAFSTEHGLPFLRVESSASFKSLLASLEYAGVLTAGV